jgi:Uma2 family endonuclease
MKQTITKRRSGPHTYDDFCAMIREGQKADLLDGVIYMASPDNTDAADLFMWLAGLIHDFAEIHDLGKVLGSRVACRLDDKNAPEPDILFIRTDQTHRIERGGIEGGPDLTIEIVSPDSVERDYEIKLEKYRAAGVLEYWIIDEHEELVTAYRLDRNGEYKEVRPRKGILSSKAIPGFWIRTEWLWPQTRPKKTNTLPIILQGPP